MWYRKSLARTDCFFYEEYDDFKATVAQCTLAEPYKCPCDIEYNDRYEDDEQELYDCKLYISKKDAVAIVKNYLRRRGE